MRNVKKHLSLIIITGVMLTVFVIAQVFGLRLCAVQSVPWSRTSLRTAFAS